MGNTILILGAGWGGLTAAHLLRGALQAEHKLTVIEKRHSFVFYPSFLKAITGESKGLRYIESPLENLVRKDIEILYEEVDSIDPANKTVTTNAQTIRADYIILALGAELYPGEVPGFREYCYNLFDTKGAFDIHEKLEHFSKGKIVILITATPFRCPPSPYEAAMLTEWFLRQRGVRSNAEISIYTPEKLPMPSAGEQVGEALRQMLHSHSINFYPQHQVIRIGENKILFSNNREATFDLLIGIPPHGVPKAIKDSGLVNSSGYIPVHPQTMEILDDAEVLTTRYPGIYAIGDNTGILLGHL
jgi:sulfide:quinone oxidoreductase